MRSDLFRLFLYSFFSLICALCGLYSLARACVHGRSVAVTGRITVAVGAGLSRGGCAARCRDQPHEQRPERHCIETKKGGEDRPVLDTH